MKIQLLGPGCPNCLQYVANTEKAVSELGLECEIEKVSDMNRILSFDIMQPPALVVDGQVKSSGKVLAVEEIKTILQAEKNL
jgi:small redox-active disulfide protein 2